MSESAADGTAATGAGASSAAPPQNAASAGQPQPQQQQQQQQQATSQAPQTQQEVDRIVLNYLNQKGYKKAETALKREANLLTLEELEASFNSAERDANGGALGRKHDKDDLTSPDAYDEAYSSLRRWVENSLDLYKVGRILH